MISLSLCMIVRDEEAVIERCLESVTGLFDEIILVDTGSVDRTRELAARYTDRIFDFVWVDDFSAARNFSFSKAGGDYLMWLDADDVLLPDDRAGLLALKQNLDPAVDLVMMKYNVGFDAGGRPTLSYYRERIFRREAGFVWQDPIHECVTPRGRLLYSDLAVTHRKLSRPDPGRNLRIFESLREQGRAFSPRMRFYHARELLYARRFAEAAEGFTVFLDSGQGWVENCVSACLDLAQALDALGRDEAALTALLRGLALGGAPRAELCCELGRRFLAKNDLEAAIFWYSQAVQRTPDPTGGGFVLPDCYDFLPYLQLCVCHDRLGDRATAAAFNEKAAAIKPDDPAIAYNRAYFQRLGQAAST